MPLTRLVNTADWINDEEIFTIYCSIQVNDKMFSFNIKKHNTDYIDLSKNIYFLNKIENVLNVYSDIAKFKVEEIGEYYRIHLISSKYDGKITLKEFENYHIDSMN